MGIILKSKEHLVLQDALLAYIKSIIKEDEK